MSVPRRFLPHTSLLVSFEAAARLGSFTAAAVEISLTQSAVSRQIRALEDQLGVELFLREKQTVRLTAAGEVYARDIRDALHRISSSTLGLRANPAGGTLNLAILPTFGTRWLAPRLPRFLDGNQGITINLSTRLSAFDFDLETFDCAIHFGRGNWPGASHELLMGEEVIPACSPQFFAQHRFSVPADLRAVPLLHLTSRPDAWEKWLRLQDVGAEHVHGMLIDQFATAAQAAVSGMGVALLPRFLIQSELDRGELVPALDLPMVSAESYYLVWPSERAMLPPLIAFKSWLRQEASAFQAETGTGTMVGQQ
ncbi:LysR family transcriptional regulator [Devosia sp. 1566]|uniref:LysR family transcriptional regulator n=1 Tax=Devosia sp. 1566 TaxID=2499144 RepID=UPI000FD98EDC|nr:LysR family transcriptional regulator [Devosia sp. 1566]